MIVGINLTSVEASLNPDSKTNSGVTVNSTPKIVDVVPAEIFGLKDVIAVKFEFVTDYTPDVGSISLQGTLIYQGANSQKILKQWKDKTALESSFAIEILNAIFHKCMTKAVILADDVRLPPPMQFPIVREGKPKDVIEEASEKKK